MHIAILTFDGFDGIDGFNGFDAFADVEQAMRALAPFLHAAAALRA